MEVHQTNNNNNPIKNFPQSENNLNINENQVNKSKKTHMNETLQKTGQIRQEKMLDM